MRQVISILHTRVHYFIIYAYGTFFLHKVTLFNPYIFPTIFKKADGTLIIKYISAAVTQID